MNKTQNSQCGAEGTINKNLSLKAKRKLKTQSCLEVDICGIKLKNPLIAASGILGYTEEFSEIERFDPEGVPFRASPSDFGAITLKSTTLKPKEGNCPPRITEVASGIVNSIGLENPGVEKVIKEILPKIKHFKTKIFASVAGQTLEEYGEVTKRFSQSPNICAIEVNISCPNVKEGGELFGQDPQTAGRVTRLVKKSTHLPVIVKLSPNVTDIAIIAKACITEGADAISLINSVRAMAIVSNQLSDSSLITHHPSRFIGGLSGPCIKPIALLKVNQVYSMIQKQKLNIPIIGMGGICNYKDVLEFIIAGANACGLGTVLLRHPLICKKIIKDLMKYLEDRTISSIDKIQKVC